MNQNITLDFTGNKSMDALLAGQPVAIMPAELAKKLLKMYADRLVSAKANAIIDNHIANLHEASENGDLNGAIEMSISWIQERDLINNVSAGNWDVYSTEPKAQVVG